MKKLISLEIQNSNFFQKDFVINFSDRLTCIMGGRGTGKSTILHFIKACLEENAEEEKDTYSILENNLGNGLLILNLSDDNGELYRIEKSFGEEPQPYLVSTTSHIPIQNLKWQLTSDIFPSQLIEKIGRDDQARLDLIDKMLVGQIDEAFEKIQLLQTELSKNSKDIRSENLRLKKLKDSLLDFAIAQEELIKYKKDQPEDILEDERVEFEMQDAAEKNRGAEERYLKKIIDSISSYFSKSSELSEEGSNISLLLKNIASFNNNQFFSELISPIEVLISETRTKAGETQIILNNILHKLQTAQKELKNIHEQQHNLFVQLKQKLDKNKAFFDRLNTLSKRVDQKMILEKETEEVEIRRKKLKTLRQNRITQFQAEKTNILQSRLKKISELNVLFNPRIKITLTPGGIKDVYEESLRNALKGHNMRYNTIIPYIINNFSPDKLAEVIHKSDVEKLRDVTSIDVERSSAVMNALHETEAIYNIETIYCPDLPDFHLKVDDNITSDIKRDDYKRSDQLSTGQRCTAVLPIAFSISFNPLIIDQPEDNLDNKYIYETIHQIIKKQKENRQLILITHNANIPVLSESEQNIFLKYEENKSTIQNEGTVEIVRENIVGLLEGGREAFIKRKELYGY